MESLKPKSTITETKPSLHDSRRQKKIYDLKNTSVENIQSEGQ